MKNLLISIIVPVYGVEKYLDKCVQSIINQTYTNLEIILVDDESPDRCPQMCDEWAKKDSRIKVFHKQNGGQGTARNFGLDKMTGDYICFVDSDDWIDSDYVEKLLLAITQTNADIAVCGMRKINESNNQTSIYMKSNKQLILNNIETLNYSYYGKDVICEGPCNKMFKSNIFKNLRFPNIKHFEDSYLHFKLMMSVKKIVVITNTLYNYFIRNNSTMGSPFSVLRYNDKQILNAFRIDFIINNNLKRFLFPELCKQMHNYIGEYIRCNDKEFKKKIKADYKSFLSKYSHIINIFNAPLKLKIKMLYMKIF